MLRDYLTADVFKAGLVQYLQKYSYKNTRNADLWNSMTNASVPYYVIFFKFLNFSWIARLLLETVTSPSAYGIKQGWPKHVFPFQICPTVGTDKNELEGGGFCRSQQSPSAAVSVWFFTRRYLGVWRVSVPSHVVTVLCRSINMCTLQKPHLPLECSSRESVGFFRSIRNLFSLRLDGNPAPRADWKASALQEITESYNRGMVRVEGTSTAHPRGF